MTNALLFSILLIIKFLQIKNFSWMFSLIRKSLCIFRTFIIELIIKKALFHESEANGKLLISPLAEWKFFRMATP